MTPESRAPEDSSPDDELLCARLEDYTQALQSGDVSRCGELLAQFPALAEFVDCLGALDGFGTNGSAAVDESTIDSGRSQSENKPGSSLNRHLSAGDKFGKFLIHEELGRGGMGVVFRATQIDLRRDVAIKVIRSHQLAGDEELRRFQVEARAAARIKHPSVVSIHEFGEIEGLHYFAMDYIRGETLAARLRHGVLSPDDAARILVSIADAVHFLHQNQVLHRDLKPSNILLDEDDQPHVTDFGLARIFGDESQQTRSGTIIGTPSYMSPEQASGRTRLIGPASDVYSLGVLLYEMLTGAPPFKEDNPLDTLVQVIEGEPRPLRQINPAIPVPLERICLKCLEKEPEKRYATTAQLAEDLRNFLAGEAVSASSTHWGERLRRWTRRHPATASRVSALLLAAIILQTRFFFFGESLAYHIQVMSVIGIWLALILVSQLLRRFEGIAPYVEYAFVTMDAFVLSVLFYITEGELGPLVIGYPFVVVASGMFFSVRVVVWCTFCACSAYSILLLLHPVEPKEPLYSTIFVFMLALLGFITAFQVYRVRVLSRFYEKR